MLQEAKYSNFRRKKQRGTVRRIGLRIPALT